MRPWRKKREPFGGLQLTGDALCLLRQCPAHLIARYLIGTIPFVIGLLFFTVDMTRSAFAPDHSAAFSALLVLLFIWMKVWQSAFMNGIRVYLLGYEATPWSAQRVVRLTLQQTAIQPFGFLLIPPAMLLGVPFPSVHYLFQNLSLLADGTREPLRQTFAQAWRLACLWPGQASISIWLSSSWLLATAISMQYGIMLLISHFLGTGAAAAIMLLIFIFIIVQFVTLLLCPLGVLVATNVSVLLLTAPWAARNLIGVSWQPATDTPGALFNDSFFLAVFAITFLILDPLTKAAAVLRCFHGEAITSGADIRLSLRRAHNRARTLLAIGLLAVSPLLAQTPTPPASTPQPQTEAIRLDHALDSALASPEYAWRLPREKHSLQITPVEPPSWFERFIDSINAALTKAGKAVAKTLGRLLDELEALMERIHDLLRRDKPMEWQNPLAGLDLMQAFFLLFAMILLATLTLFLLRLRKSRAAQTARQTQHAIPDLHADTVSAADLPTNEWLNLADSLIQKGDLRLAMRALFLGVLAELGARRLLGLTTYKSNRDYRRELHRRAHDRPDLLTTFHAMIRTLECAWYGHLPVDQPLLDAFRSQQQQIFNALPITRREEHP